MGASELVWKRNLVEHDIKFIDAGKASSITDEREFLVAATDGKIDNSIVIGNGAHIRRTRIVWDYYHPDANLRFISTDMRNDDDPENPILAQRYWQVWLTANLVGLPAYKLLGVEYFAKKNFSQPVDTSN